ncbi:MAG: PqqD family protein [Motilibacteraceae bacterium]
MIVLNTTAQAVWELCDGSTTMPEMVHALLTLFDAPEATIRHDVSEALIELSRHGLLSQPQEEPA